MPLQKKFFDRDWPHLRKPGNPVTYSFVKQDVNTTVILFFISITVFIPDKSFLAY